MKYRINVGVTTNKGSYRNHNEDNFLYNGIYLKNTKEDTSVRGKCKIPMLFAVCDGMGGSEHGKEASFTAIDVLNRSYDSLNEVDKDIILQELDQLIKKVNLSVYSLEQQGKKTGCTLALVYLHTDKIYIANVGDSRIYRYAEHELVQLSIDHNQAQDMLGFGLRIGGQNKKKNVLTQYIGMSPREVIIEPHYETIEYDDMTLLLCSDGLSEVLSQEEMTDIILKYQNNNLKDATNCLVAQAIEQGARDNLTAMLVKIYKR